MYTLYLRSADSPGQSRVPGGPDPRILGRADLDHRVLAVRGGG